jgi:branched-chain amino acid transport system substrate-binding protein
MIESESWEGGMKPFYTCRATRVRWQLAVVAIAALTWMGTNAVLAESGPIKVGAVSTLTGPFTFPESTAAAKAVFDRVNAQGGINGRKIEYLVEDDKADPGAAGQAAHRLVDNEQVVANVGSASLLECAVNSNFYVTRNFLSIQGTGVDPSCYSTPDISPVNTGPYTGLTISLYFASEVLKKDDVCSFAMGIPVQQAGWEAAINRYTKVTGKKLKIDDRTVKPTDDLTQFVLKAQRSGCKASVFVGIEPLVIAWMQAANAQNVTGITWIFLTPAYTENVAKVLGKDGDGIYANSEFEPFLTPSPVLGDWLSLMNSAGVSRTSFSEGGYLAATLFVDVLKSIKGEINRVSVTSALRDLKPISTPMMGTPYTFGNSTQHAANSSSKFVQLHNGQWVVETPDFVKLPD